MSHDTVQLAQLNRKANKVASTKGGNRICDPLKVISFSPNGNLRRRIFHDWRGGLRASEGVYKLVNDRSERATNKARHEKDKSKECFGLYGQATKRIWWMPRQ